MARYIDADKLKERLEDFSRWCMDGRKQGVDFVLDCPLPAMLDEDVVPKSEVAKIFEEVEKAHDECIWIDITTRIGYLQQTKFEHKLAELKKKYTEEKYEN